METLHTKVWMIFEMSDTKVSITHSLTCLNLQFLGKLKGFYLRIIMDTNFTSVFKMNGVFYPVKILTKINSVI